MSNEIARQNGGTPARMTPEDAFKADVMRAASRAMVATMGSAAGTKAAARVALAFVAAVRQAKTPGDLMRCSPESVQTCIANSAETGLMPGGAYPTVWLVPRAGQLRWEISHRGIATLAQRAGYGLRAVAVHVEDPSLVLAFGEVEAHEPDPDLYPETLDQLRGVYVVIKRLSDGQCLGRPWVPGALIRKRAASSQAGPVWRSWPVEMAIKTAIKYTMARGDIVIDSSELSAAIQAEAETDREEAHPAASASRIPPAQPPADLALPAPAGPGADLEVDAELDPQ